MFWGLIMEPQRRYSQTVKRAFHISMAALDESTSDDSPTQVICTFDERNYLLCTLEKGKTSQVTLDLNYEIGDKISFATNGKAHVHLTGYLMDEQFSLDEGEEEEEEEDTVKDESAKSKKRQIKEINSAPKKKFKTLELLEAVDSNDEDDSDDSDVNTTDLVEDDDLDTTAVEEDESGEDEEADEEEDDEDSGEEEEEDNVFEGEDSDDESSSLSEDEEIQVTKKAVENGVSGKKTKKDKLSQQQSPNKAQQQQQQQQQKQKQKKNKGEKTPVEGDKANKSKVDQTPAKGEKTPAKTDKTQTKGDKTPNKSPNKHEGGSPQKKQVEGGVIIEDVRVGNGAVAKPGKFVRVYYEGKFKNNNKTFDSTTKGAGFEFRLGRQEVIKGWDVGVSGMRVGGKRRIICPPNMAYGQKGSPPTIPPNSTLVFEVELKNVK